MKNVIAILTTLMSFNALAADSPWSVFASEGKLYVTTLADCNHVSAFIEVPEECSSARLTRELVLQCIVKVRMMKTEMGCPQDQVLVAKTSVIDLKKSNLTSEVQTLHVQGPGKVIILDLRK